MVPPSSKFVYDPIISHLYKSTSVRIIRKTLLSKRKPREVELAEVGQNIQRTHFQDGYYTIKSH